MQNLKGAYFIGIFLMYITSMYPWFVWNNNISVYVCMFTCFMSIYCMCFQSKMYIQLSVKNVVFFLILFFTLIYESSILNINGKILYIYVYIVILSLSLLKPEYQSELLRFITKYFAIFLLISLIAYILYFIKLFPISPTYIENSDGRYGSLNYYLFILTLRDSLVDFVRFKSVFMEPGHLTMGLVPLIFANKFNLKNKYVLILFVSALFTFSLAAYVVMSICYFLLNFNYKNIKRLIISVLVVIASLFIIYNCGYGEILDEFIMDRLEFTGGFNIAGDNRVTDEFEVVYKSVINSQYVYFGNDAIDINAFGGISGYKKYLVQYGIFGCILVLLLYSTFFFQYRSHSLFAYSLVFIMLLYQNAYPFWNCVIIMYVLGSCIYKNENKNIIYRP